MKAARIFAPGEIEIIEVPMPIRNGDHVLVRMDTATVCGSDLHDMYGRPDDRYPFQPGQMGHECVGIVEVSDNNNVQPGDRMLVIPPNYNAFADYVSIAPKWLIPLPDELDTESAVLGQQLGTVIFCCRRLSNVIDKTAVVIGQGPAGLLFTALLYRMGARKVIGLDLVDHRLDVSLRVGAEHVVNVEKEDPIGIVYDLTDGDMADLVVEAVGKSETINLCAGLVRQRGQVAFFGVPKRVEEPVRLDDFLRKNVSIITSVGAQWEPGLRSFRLALDIIAQKRLDLAPLISHRVPFSRIKKAFDLAETKRDGAVKVLIKFEQ